MTAAPSTCPDAQRQRRPQDSGEAAGGHGRGGSGSPPSSGPGGQTPGPERAEGGRRVSGTLSSGSLWAPRLRGRGPGAQGPRRDAGGLGQEAWADPLRTGPLSHRPGSPGAGRGEGENVRLPLTRKWLREVTLASPWLGTSLT